MKGVRNEEIRQNQPFCAFRTIALPTDRQTNRPTDMTSYRSARTHLKTGRFILSTDVVFGTMASSDPYLNFNDHFQSTCFEAGILGDDTVYEMT